MRSVVVLSDETMVGKEWDYIVQRVSNVSEKLQNNPKFSECYFREIADLYRGYQAMRVRIETYENENGFSVAFDNAVLSHDELPECIAGKNSTYKRVDFKVDDDGNMVISKSKGVLFDSSDFMRDDNELCTDLMRQYKNSADVPKVLQVYCEYQKYDSNGVEFERGTYSDITPIAKANYGFNDVATLVGYDTYNPIAKGKDFIFDGAGWEFEPHVAVYERVKDTPGICFTRKRDGYDSKRKGNRQSFWLISNEHPETLGCEDWLVQYENGAAKVNEEYYGNVSAQDIKQRANASFLPSYERYLAGLEEKKEETGYGVK